LLVRRRHAADLLGPHRQVLQQPVDSHSQSFRWDAGIGS
jgi:hypothetical protein